MSLVAVCDAGYILDPDDILACLPCEHGTYQPEPAEYRPLNETVCSPCPDGTTTQNIASTLSTDCQGMCSDFQLLLLHTIMNPSCEYLSTTIMLLTAEICPSGEHFVGDVCTLCPRGYFKDNTLGIAESFGDCQICDVELITPGTGSIAEANCTQGDYCTSLIILPVRPFDDYFIEGPDGYSIQVIF